MINYWVNQRIRELGVEFRYSFENSFVNFFKNTISCFRKCVSLNVTQLFGGGIWETAGHLQLHAIDALM